MNIHNQVICSNTGIIIKGKHITITKQSHYYIFDRKSFCHILFYREKKIANSEGNFEELLRKILFSEEFGYLEKQ